MIVVAAAMLGAAVLAGSSGPRPLAEDEVAIATGEAESTGRVASAPDQDIEGPPPLAEGEVHRLAGPNRFITSADAAQRLWFDGAETMTVATGLDYPDALAGAAVAASADAPVVLATRDELPSSVRQTIIDRAPERVRLLGGEAVLSSQLAQEIRDLPGSPEVDRIAGADRFASAQAAADAAGGVADGDVAVADGGGYADALAAGSLAAGDAPTPVVLASDDKVEADISQASRALLIGGPASVSPEAEADADAQTGVTRRLAGPTRWATSLQVADFTLTDRLTGDVPLVVATGEGFADGLSAGAIAARSGGPLLLIPTDGPTDAQARWIADHHQRLTGAWIVGGAEAISPAAVEQIDQQLDGR